MSLSVRRKSSLLLLLCLLFTSMVQGQNKEIPPKPGRLVSDFARVLQPGQQRALEAKLLAFNDSTGNQIAILLDQSLDGDEVFRYSQQVAETWGIGQGERNNGVLIYASIPDRKMWIQVGRGLEPVITDLASSQIYNNILRPAFKQGQYYEGLDRATTDLMKLAVQEFSADQYVRPAQGQKQSIPIWVIILIIIFLIFIFRRRRKAGRWGSFMGGMGPFFPPFIGGGGFGRGGGFGGGGGGFGGFGGGSFGGGGAGGDW